MHSLIAVERNATQEVTYGGINHRPHVLRREALGCLLLPENERPAILKDILCFNWEYASIIPLIFLLLYHIHPSRKLCPSAECLQRLVTRARRLYEQGAGHGRLRRYCGAVLTVLLPAKEVSSTIWFSSLNNCRSAVSPNRRGVVAPVSDLRQPWASPDCKSRISEERLRFGLPTLRNASFCTNKCAL
jgi:hypothetical protein